MALQRCNVNFWPDFWVEFRKVNFGRWISRGWIFLGASLASKTRIKKFDPRVRASKIRFPDFGPKFGFRRCNIPRRNSSLTIGVIPIIRIIGEFRVLKELRVLRKKFENNRKSKNNKKFKSKNEEQEYHDNEEDYEWTFCWCTIVTIRMNNINDDIDDRFWGNRE